ncbi:MAG: yhdN 4 [Betaproteobacteria bacterium]|nr:yhdN 4 [Betaproteobacteria bacterium]
MVAPLAFGGNVFGWTIDEAKSFSLLDAFVDAGFNLVDTADVYSRWVAGNQGGESETIIGKWLKRSGRRGQVVLATKVGMEMGPDRKGLAKTYILRAVEDSLKRLQTDHIDLYQSHKDDESTPLEETAEAYDLLIKQGKVRAIGASNFSAARLKAALDLAQSRGLPVYQSLQPHYNLLERAGYEAELEPLCRERNVGVIGYYSLASGFLTGKYRSDADLAKSPRGAGVKKYLDARGLRVLAALDTVAKQHSSTPTAVALAWLIARPGVTAPIVSATSVAQLQQVLEGARLQLDAASIAALDTASLG